MEVLSTRYRLPIRSIARSSTKLSIASWPGPPSPGSRTRRLGADFAAMTSGWMVRAALSVLMTMVAAPERATGVHVEGCQVLTFPDTLLARVSIAPNSRQGSPGNARVDRGRHARFSARLDAPSRVT